MTERPAATLAFSTLACPEWDAAMVIARAVAFGFDGVEWRGGPDGTVRTDWTADQRRGLRARIERSGLASIAVTAYSNLVAADPQVRQASVDDLLEHVELAADLGAPVVRVFLGIRDDEAGDAELVDRAVGALRVALAGAARRGVALAIEPHDDHVRADAVRPILDAIADPTLGIVWDIANAWAAGDDPDVGLRSYGDRIRYVQVKDGVGRGDAWRLCAVGSGEVPLARALAGLARAAAAGGRPLPPISVEWERAWHPELAPAENALPAARAWLLTALATAVEVAGLAASRGDRQ